MQDQYAATFGGFNFIEFGGDRVIVNPLRIAADVVNELEHNMLLCYTGATRRSDGIIEDQAAALEQGEQDTLSGLREQKELAVEMKNALLRRRAGRLRRRCCTRPGSTRSGCRPQSPTRFIDEAYAEARRRGRAGRQGHRRRRRRLHAVLLRVPQEAPGGRGADADGRPVTEFAFEHDGLTTWSMDDG